MRPWPLRPPRRSLFSNRVFDPGARGGGSSPAFSVPRRPPPPPAPSRYFAEVLRQCGGLDRRLDARAAGHCRPMIGGECEHCSSSTLTRPLGATAAVAGSCQVPCSLRELLPYMFGYIFAARWAPGWWPRSARCGRRRDRRARLGRHRPDEVRDRHPADRRPAVRPHDLHRLDGDRARGGYLVTTVQLGDLSGAQYLDGYFSARR